MEARCLKCRQKVEILDAEKVQTKRGMEMIKGKCPVCSTTVCRMLGKVKKE